MKDSKKRKKRKKKKVKKKKKQNRNKQNWTFNKTRNISAIIYFIVATTAMVFVILWYLNVYRA